MGELIIAGLVVAALMAIGGPILCVFSLIAELAREYHDRRERQRMPAGPQGRGRVVTKIIRAPRYWIGKAFLAARSTYFIIGCPLFIVGVLLCLHARSNITPSSVHVSSYHRSDGTYVPSYSRRPPGSREHDGPYEQELVFALLLCLATGPSLAIFFCKLFGATPMELLPEPTGITTRVAVPWSVKPCHKKQKRYEEAMIRHAETLAQMTQQNHALRREQFKRYYGSYPDECA